MSAALRRYGYAAGRQDGYAAIRQDGYAAMRLCGSPSHSPTGCFAAWRYGYTALWFLSTTA